MVGRLNDEVWTTGDLLERLERRDKFSVLDVRNRDEFDRFRLEGPQPCARRQYSLFRELELGGKDEMLDAPVIPSLTRGIGNKSEESGNTVFGALNSNLEMRETVPKEK